MIWRGAHGPKTRLECSSFQGDISDRWKGRSQQKPRMLRLTHWCDGHTHLLCGHRLLNRTFWTWHLMSYGKHETHFHSHDQRMRDAFWLLFFFWSLHETRGVLVLRPGIEPRPLAMKKCWVLTTRPPGNSCFLPLCLWLVFSHFPSWAEEKERWGY